MRPISFVTLAAFWGRKGALATAPPSSRDTEASLTFTALTNPLPLFPGEVTNTWHQLAIPSGPIAISEFGADVVEKDVTTGEIVPVPLGEAYLHHHVVYSNHRFYDDQRNVTSPMKPRHSNRGVGFGAGTESRGTKQRFPHPYRFTTIEGEDELLANVHLINMRTLAPSEAHHCLECPCNAEDYVAEDDGRITTTLLNSVIERKRNWDRCNSALVDEENPSCFSNTYSGGLYCCEHGEFCLDDYFLPKDVIAQAGNSTQSVFYLRYTLTYTPVTPEVKPLYLAACCDASGDETRPGNVEYDIPKCADNDDGCVHELETIQALHGADKGTVETGGPENEEDAHVDVVYMVGHLHRGGISVSSYFMNGTALCESLPAYGTGERGEIGNEPGYINSMSACTFDPPLRMKTTDKIRVVGRYNATEAHTGVMSLFYIAIADADESVTAGVSWTFAHSLAAVVLIGSMVGVAYHVANKFDRRRNYESIPNEGEISV
mmetsp:Transcript_55692/g.118453  ORF Transcript_55692/g.118453 Transcript_55692/m.118453 type:complete len:490 (+) Transcript_55692:80-1549(+)